ncbi:D-arabinono-1,4-lactone oxidase [Marasmius crinis-equi]|uniref:D-arabinono-1,4-lactone oxidase n=1 Tax=Marasmius crinis-equi TaxID=585013 RepID=A0ABR3FVP5_9AGAR
MASRFTVPLDEIPLQHLYDALRPCTAPSPSSGAAFTNWAHTFACKPLVVFEPEDEYQCELILELARREGKVVRAAGVGHSPSDIACTNEFLLRTTKLNHVLKVDAEKKRVIVQGGITLSDLHVELEKQGLAMINLGSISDQTLAGIIATATHGTGITYGVLSTHVLSLNMLLADGSRVRCSRQEHPELFTASLCGLGTTGLLMSIEMEVEPAFRLKENHEARPFQDVMANLTEVVHSAEHARFYWFPAADTIVQKTANRTHEDKIPRYNWVRDTFFGYHVVQFLLFLGLYSPTVTAWTTRFSCWLEGSGVTEIDASYRVFNFDCKYRQHTTEWAIPFNNTVACLRDLHDWWSRELNDPRGLRPHVPVEIRFSASDDIWLSPSTGRLTCWIGIVQYKPYGFNVPYRKLFDGFERIVASHQGRPHWAKAHRLRPDDLRACYPRFDDFVRVVEEVDPKGMFRNEYIQRHIFGKPVDSRVYKSRA